MNWHLQLRKYLGLSLNDYAHRIGVNKSHSWNYENVENSFVRHFTEKCDFFCVNCTISAKVKGKEIEVSTKENFFTAFRKQFDLSTSALEICVQLGRNDAWFYNVENVNGQEQKSIENLIYGLGGQYKLIFSPYTPNQLAARRFEAVKRHQNGESHRKIAPYFGVHFTTIGEWCTLYEKHGVEGLKKPLKIRPNRKINMALLKRTYEAETNPEKREILDSILELAKTKSLTQTALKYNISPQALAKRRMKYLREVGVIL